jgi:hypothetical protein
MNTVVIAPEVQAFLTKVRAQLADLDPEEQREILDGLEADLIDLVAERGGGALGDPVSYARELRGAAGFSPEMGKVRQRWDLSHQVHAFFDEVRALWDRLVGRMPGDAAGLLAAVQPVWWVLRGWIAVEMAAMWFGDWSLSVVPGGGVLGAGAVILGVALSIQLGRGRLWPGERVRRLAGLRALLVGLNLFALARVPVVLGGLDHPSGNDFTRGYRSGVETGYANGMVEGRRLGSDKAGLYLNGTWVSNIYPYDAQGRPLVGVQLFNQVGKPINVVTQPEYPDDACTPDDQGDCTDATGTVDANGNALLRVFYPWTNGAAQLLNVFPIPSRVQDGKDPSPTAFTDKVRPEIGPYPHASVPDVSLPGIRTGRQPVAVTPAPAG